MSWIGGPRSAHFSPIALTLAAIMLAAFAYIAFGPDFEYDFAGTGALLAIPFCFGALVALGGGKLTPLSWLAAPMLLSLIVYLTVEAGWESLICVVMIMPIWGAAAMVGALIVLAIGKVIDRDDPSPPDDDEQATRGVRLKSVGLAVLPFLLIQGESQTPPVWETHAVSSSIDVDAAAEEIWPLLIAIPDIRADEGLDTTTHDWLGVPRPSDAQLVIRGGELVRKAQWGPAIRFEEVVTKIEPGRRIAWRFAFPDDSVQNHTDRHISPDGAMLKIATGSYSLRPLTDDRTRITLTTTYRTRTRFDWYLGWWGEQMLGDIHENVLAIVAQRSEQAAASR